MKANYAVITAEHAYLRSEANDRAGIEDEIFSGWAVRMLPAEESAGGNISENEDAGNADCLKDQGNSEHAEDTKEINETKENGNGESLAEAWIKVETHYGYTGFVRSEELREISEEELRARQDKTRFFRIGMPEADLLDQPKVQGLPLEMLLKNSIVELLEYEAAEGWSRGRTAAGREGYIHTPFLRERREDDGHLLQEKMGEHAYFQDLCRRAVMSTKETAEHDTMEEEVRESLVRSAKEYLGTQYRWGGKSSQGLDCSGLAFMSYFDNGILLWRDAQIVEGYPIREISREQLKKGDLIFFPGHVAMYIGNDHYIHATGYCKTPCVTINSLNEQDEDCRRDLIGKITGYGSIFS